jgi:hypothetical protein
VAVPSAPDTITGRVVSVNPKGVKLDGRAEWFNFSKFAPDLVPPMRGETVSLTLDRQGFVRAIEATGGPQEPATGRLHAGVQKDRTITRLAVLKAAAEFAARMPNASSSDVLKVAEAWEAWVNRPYDGPELADAF